MSWNTLDPAIRTLAETHLTPGQLATWKLELAGLSTRAIATSQDLARSTVIDRLRAAHRTLRRHGLRQDASGNWHLTNQEAAA